MVEVEIDAVPGIELTEGGVDGPAQTAAVKLIENRKKVRRKG